MPLGHEEFYGTNADETENREYCKFCFFNGHFVESKLSLKDMIERSVQYMTTELDYAEENARKISEEVIPQLKRWIEVK